MSCGMFKYWRLMQSVSECFIVKFVLQMPQTGISTSVYGLYRLNKLRPCTTLPMVFDVRWKWDEIEHKDLLQLPFLSFHFFLLLFYFMNKYPQMRE